MSDVFIMCPRSGNYCTHTGCNVNWRLCDEQRSLASDRTETDLPEEKNDLYEACKNECLRLQQMIIKLQDREEILKGAYENALNRIEELKHKDEKMNEEKKQEWISVKERLPEEGEEVLVWSDRYGRTFATMTGQNKYGTIWLYKDDPIVTFNAPSHWQPLPKGPDKN